MAIPDGLTVRVVEDAPGTWTLVLPPVPSELQTVVAGEEWLAADATYGHCGCCMGCQ